MEGVMLYSAILTAINCLLIAGLLYVYLKNYSFLRSTFTLGLILFSLIFLVQNAISLYFYFTMMELYADGVEGYVFVLSAMQFVAFAILNWISWR